MTSAHYTQIYIDSIAANLLYGWRKYRKLRLVSRWATAGETTKRVWREYAVKHLKNYDTPVEGTNITTENLFKIQFGTYEKPSKKITVTPRTITGFGLACKEKDIWTGHWAEYCPPTDTYIINEYDERGRFIRSVDEVKYIKEVWPVMKRLGYKKVTSRVKQFRPRVVYPPKNRNEFVKKYENLTYTEKFGKVFNAAYNDSKLDLESAQKVVTNYTQSRAAVFSSLYGANNDRKKDMSIKVTSPTLINGRGADSYSVQDLINVVTSAEATQASLKAMKTKSKTVSALIAKEQAGIDAVVAILDAREVDADE